MNTAAELTLSPRAYSFIADLVYERSRIHLGKDKQSLVVSRLRKRLTQLGLHSFEDYCQLLQGGDPAELGKLVDLISTNHTQFFREIEHFRFLRETALPELVRRLGKTGEPIRIWSAACSSGQEPYSIAILLSEFFRAGPPVPWRIEASDISTRMLDRAREGIYRTEDLRLPESEWLRRYFQKGSGDYDGYCRLKESVRSTVTFHHLNLLDARSPVCAGQHVVFCRNVMIYFDAATQQELIGRLMDKMAPGAWLVVGHSESLLGARHALERVRPSVYRRS